MHGETMKIWYYVCLTLYCGCFDLYACGIWCCDFQVMCPVLRMLVYQHPKNRKHNPQLHTRPATWKPQHEIPHVATTV